MNDFDPRVSFTSYFGVKKSDFNKSSFFDISLISDVPLFIDPFHLFYSDDKDYEALHDEIIKYLSFLRDYSIKLEGRSLTKAELQLYYHFPEVKQNWLGYSPVGNNGRGLGEKFADALNNNFYKLFNTGTPGHLEKLTLVTDRVGKDSISDFTTNLIHAHLAAKTEVFAKKYIKPEKLSVFTIKKAEFDYKSETWKPKRFTLPKFEKDYVILTPKELLTKEETWINKKDFIDNFDEIPYAMQNEALREQLIKYFNQKLNEYSEKKTDKKTGETVLKRTDKTRRLAVQATTQEFPQVIEVYISQKEERGDQAIKISEEFVNETENFKENQYTHFVTSVKKFKEIPTTYDEAKVRATYFKECVESELYVDFYNSEGVPANEEWIQRQFRYVWGGTISDVYRESKRGPARIDYVASRGSQDKCVIEFKLAGSKTLKKNLQKQLDAYKELYQAQHGIWIIIVFNNDEYQKLQHLVEELKLNTEDIIVVDARKENKIPPSKR